jgi:hypothetical protein
MISRVLHLYQFTINYNTTRDLNIRKLCAKIVPHKLTNVQKVNRMKVCLDLLYCLKRGQIPQKPHVTQQSPTMYLWKNTPFLWFFSPQIAGYWFLWIILILPSVNEPPENAPFGYLQTQVILIFTHSDIGNHCELSNKFPPQIYVTNYFLIRIQLNIYTLINLLMLRIIINSQKLLKRLKKRQHKKHNFLISL